MKILVLLFAIFIGFGFLIQNTFSPAKQSVEQIRHEYSQTTTPPVADAQDAGRVS